ncbi:MAG TPA: hypothetical protein VGN16_07690 [Acidobacteriaceae bacterium]
MATLEDNLKLGFEAAKYAKLNVPRSGNQTYYKKWRERTNKKRNLFMLGYMRGGSHWLDTDEGREQWFTDPGVEQKRKQVKKMLRETPDLKAQEQKLDEFIKQWGEGVFFAGRDDNGREVEDVRKGRYITDKMCRDVNNLSDAEIEHIAKRLKKSTGEVKQLIQGDGDAWNRTINEYSFADSVHAAAKNGIGNCGEKADLAAYYLLDRTPGGKRLTVYCLDSEHKLMGNAGDHAFVVFGHDDSTENVGTLGANAVIVDGWMNDVYPAQHSSKWMYGFNYDNHRINLKQVNIRALICKFYRSHIKISREFNVPAQGPGNIHRPQVSDKVPRIRT